MFSNAESHFAYQMANAPLRTFPFSHAYVEKAFPEDFYGVLQQHLPTDSQLAPIAEKRPVKGYRERFVMCFDDDSLALLDAARREFWQQFRECFRRGMIGGLLLDKFGSEVQERFRNSDEFTFHDELLLINDRDGYALGPHTDSPRKVVSLLFYLPADMANEQHGTSIYLPKDPGFRCEGGPHYSHEGFNKLATMPFHPNSAFCFLKTDRSFHGVEPMPAGSRWLLLYDVYVEEFRKPAKVAPSSPVSFSF